MWSYDFITEMFLTLYSEMDIFFYYPLNSHFKCFTFMCVDCNFFFQFICRTYLAITHVTPPNILLI